MPQDTPVDLAITGDAVRPRALAIDELARLRPDARPGIPVRKRREHPLGKALWVARRKQIAGLAVADQLAMTADARSDDDALLRHGLERLERGHQLGQAGRNAREDEQVDQIVITAHLLMRDASGENDAFAKTEFAGQSPQPVLFRPAADQQYRDIRPLMPHIRDCAQQQVQTLIGIERAEEAENDLPESPSRVARVRSGIPGPANLLRSTALGMTVTLSPGTPRAIASARKPSQIVVTASAR